MTDGDRTRDNWNHNPGLYQLSYSHHWTNLLIRNRSQPVAQTNNGAPGRIRTCDPRLRRPLLYPTELRAHKYAGPKMVGVEGFEPPTFCSQSRRATRLRYTPTTMARCHVSRASIIPLPTMRVNVKIRLLH